jgi:hypothetical protein
MNYVINAAYEVDDSTKTHAVALTSEVQSFAEDVVEYAGQIPVLNWLGGVSRGTGAGKSVWNSYDLRWYSVGGVGGSNDEVNYSRDAGVSWTAMTPPSLSLKAVDLDFAPEDGVVVVCYASGQKVSKWNGATWSDITVFGASATNAAVVYDPVNELWCVAGEDGAQRVYTSPDGTTWTSRTSAMPGSSTPRLWINKATGRIVSTSVSSSSVQITTSDDGGVTWTLRTAVSPSITGLATSNVSLACNDDGVWLLAASDGVDDMKIYVSTDDGTTFTLAKDLTGLGATFNFCMANLGELWALLKWHTSSGLTLIYSVDNGATWRDTGWTPNGAVTGVNMEVCIAASDSGFMMTLALDDVGMSYPSIRVGLPGKLL